MTEEKIRIVCLSNGDKVIGRVKGDTISKPLQMIPIQDPKGLSITFIPWIFGGKEDDELAINMNHVVCFAEPEMELESRYRNMTSAIKTPPKQGNIKLMS